MKSRVSLTERERQLFDSSKMSTSGMILIGRFSDTLKAGRI